MYYDYYRLYSAVQKTITTSFNFDSYNKHFNVTDQPSEHLTLELYIADILLTKVEKEA